MARPRKKQPKQAKNQPSALGTALTAIGDTIINHPSIAGGGTAFLVIFSFVSANALWYQPGKHPAPLLDTRSEMVAPAGVIPAQRPVTETGEALTVEDLIATPAHQVTTVRIQREDMTQTASIPTPTTQRIDQTQEASNAPVLAKVDIQNLQEGLAALGHYDGKVDGLTGPKTAAAVSAFEQSLGMTSTGTLTPELVALVATRAQSALAAKAKAEAEATVRQIQSGLRKFAYADIEIDGIAGSKTKAAIRDFQKHYRLPVTGEPEIAVLEKLQAIGAI